VNPQCKFGVTLLRIQELENTRIEKNNSPKRTANKSTADQNKPISQPRTENSNLNVNGPFPQLPVLPVQSKPVDIKKKMIPFTKKAPTAGSNVSVKSTSSVTSAPKGAGVSK
jgi:hypothetical protein